MKNVFLKRMAVAIIAAVAMGVTVHAQTPTFVQGDNVVNAGIGFGGYYSGAFYNNVKRIPFVSLSYENCIKDNLFNEYSSLGIGGILGYTSVSINDYYKTSNTLIGVRGALHYAFVDKLDTYAGLLLGYGIVSWKWLDSGWTGSGNASSSLVAGGFLGARYYFTDNIAAFAEAGYGAANINLGIALKF